MNADLDNLSGVAGAAPADGPVHIGLPPLPMRAGHLTVAQLVDLYMAHYSGADGTRQQRLGWWCAQIGTTPLQDLSDDHVHAALEALAAQQPRYYAGNDADGRPIYKAKRAPLAPATVNRYAASLAAVVTWAIKRRIAPKGYVHPCRSVERRTEHNEKTRFLSAAERARLLTECKAAAWPRMYALVLMAMTTGARKGELLGLRWRDVDLDAGQARIAQTKNGDPRLLPLVPAVVEELRRFKAGPALCVFPSSVDANQPARFELQFVAAVKAAKLKDVTFHTLRHTAASILAASGATLVELADFLGHRQMQMTKRYSHLCITHKKAMVERVMGGMQ